MSSSKNPLDSIGAMFGRRPRPVTQTPDVTEQKQEVRILLIEDSAGDVLMVKHLLGEVASDYDFAFTDVARLVDAFRLMEQERFDIIMLDLNLLDFDGVVSVAVLHGEKPEVPIIVYSGTDNDRVREQAMLNGAVRYLVKGQENGTAIYKAIENVLDNRPQA
ncbi:MAG: response regulator [Alphaproteobacteria bacterium]|nr:response regulator [Alphaproteobacteria bacterium]